MTQTSALSGKGKKPCRGLREEGVAEGGAERRRYYLYAPLYVSRESREYCSRHPAHTLRAQAGRGRTNREGVVVVAWQAFITATTYLLT